MRMVKLGDLSYIKTGKIDVNAAQKDGRYPFFTCSKTPYKINDYAFDCEAILVAGNGDLNVKYYKGKFNAYQRTYVIQKRDNNDIDMKYLYYFMMSYIDFLQKKSIGGIIKYIKIGHLTEADIPLPILDDQIRIAYLLGKVETLIAQRRQSLQKLDDLLNSVFLDMFGDPVRNEKGWKVGKFGEIIFSSRNGLSPSTKGKEKGYVYTLSAITGNSFREIFKEDYFLNIDKKYFPSNNDFLICRGNGNLNLVGKGYFYPNNETNIMFPDTIINVTIKPNSINQYFLESLWKTLFVRYQIEKNARTANGTYKINQGVINEINIIHPPLSLQNQFSAIVEKVEHIKNQYQQSLTELENLYGALSQKAFKGELDLSRIPVITEPDIQQHFDDAETIIDDIQPILPKETPYLYPEVNVANIATPKGRARLLLFWFEQTIQTMKKETLFSVEEFWRKAQFHIMDYWDENSEIVNNIYFDLADYDYLKELVFEQLASGQLQQVLVDPNKTKLSYLNNIDDVDTRNTIMLKKAI